VSQPGANGEDRYHLQILSRALSVLFAFSRRSPEWTLEGLSTELDLNKTSLLRIIRTLEGEKLLHRQGERYRLGPRVLDLGYAFLSTLSVVEVAQPYMYALSQHSGQTVSLAILDDFDVVYIAIEHSQREIGIQGEIGGRHPAHATSLGKILLADLGDDELRERLAGRELERLTHRTVVDAEDLVSLMSHVRESGYAIDDEERGIGIRCVAAPIRDHRGKVVAAMSVSGPIFHMTDAALPNIRDRLITAAARASEELGFVERETAPA
jgi:IclR family pca regulon transcriptional regulator